MEDTATRKQWKRRSRLCVSKSATSASFCLRFVSLQYKAAQVQRNSVIATEMFNGDQAVVITSVKL